jgi:WD40 repeat protein
VAFTPDGKTVATAGSDWLIHLWNVADGKLQRTLVGHGQAVFGLAISPDGTRLLSSGADSTVRLWDMSTGEEKQPLFSPRRFVRQAAFSMDGRWLLVAGNEGAHICEASIGTTRALVRSNNAHGADLAADIGLIAVAGMNDGVQVFPIDLRTADAKQSSRITELIKKFADDDYKVREAASRELEKIGMIAEPQLREGIKSPNAEVRVRCRAARRQVMSPKPLNALKEDRTDAEVVSFSPDGKFLAGGYRGGEIKIWKVGGFELVTTLRAVTK